MSLTPERRVTPPGTGHGTSVHSLVNSGVFQDRYTDVPTLRVESVERSTSSLSTQSQTSLASTKGNVLDSVYSSIATFLVKFSVGSMVLVSLIVMAVGEDLVIYFSQLFGFIMIFLMVFSVSFGGYIWWMSWVHEAINLTRHSTLMMLLTFECSEVISTVANHMIDLGGYFNSIPIDLSFYAINTISLFCFFASLVHHKGTSAMFAHETCIFVAFTIVMHYTTASIFSKILPGFIYCQLVYGSCFLAMCISLVLLNNQPNISLVGLGRLIRTSMHTKRDNIFPASYAGRRFSNVSLMSNFSSVRPKNSITDQSSFSGYHRHDSMEIDPVGLTEANGMLGDLLIREDRLTQKGRESLKKIQQLLTIKAPRNSIQYIPRSRLGSGDSDITSGGSTYGTPNTRRVSFSQKRNQGSQFTTTTTSTGLPNVEKDPQERKRFQGTRMSLAEGGRPSIHRFSSSPLAARQYKKSLPNMTYHSVDQTDGRVSSGSSLTQSESSAPNSEDEGSAIKKLKNRSDSLDVISEDDEKSTSTGSNKNKLIASSQHISSETETDNMSQRLNNVTNTSSNSVLIHFNNYIEPSPVSIDNYDNSSIAVLELVCEWDFPIFEMETLSNGHILSQMAFRLFREAGLMETFNIPKQEFINYFRALEASYGSKTYHNKTHAADVIHATSFLLFEEIPEFSYDQSDTIGGGSRQWIGNLRSKDTGGNIASAFSSLEVFACYMAAAMHDFDHPGRTNAFLVATRNPMAVLYNDRSVLENHHAAASWDLLMSHNNKNFLNNLESSELKRLRFLIIECILATDLKQHFEIVRDFREKFDPDAGGIDWSNDIDRLQVMKMVIKMADINTPTKSWDLHRSWTVRITEEFYQQHEDEMALNLPQTIFMDRQQKDKLPAIQVSFIQNLVAPLFRACAEVGIIPGVAETADSSSRGEGLPDEEIEPDEEDDDSIPDEAGALIRPTKKIYSIILTNLQMNYESWKDELPKEDIESVVIGDDSSDEDSDD